MAVKDGDIAVGLVGLGMIGGDVAKGLIEKSEMLTRQVGTRVVLKRIVEVDDRKHGSLGLQSELFITDYYKMLNNDDIDIVIELIGGEHPAFEYIREALKAGKYVVTANKEVMAKHGEELLKLAHEKQVNILYEASVGGGIPLIAPFKRDLIVNDIFAIYAIVNGTTNYILTRMTHDGLDFSVALKQAQELGYAEANPVNDIEGLDATYKLAILATIAFNTEVGVKDIYHEGISRLEARDFRYARELGYAIKLLAIAKKTDGNIEARVHPVFIPEDSLLAKVDGVYNAIDVEGDLVGKVIFYGQGAGPSATSSAVLADVVNIAQNINRGVKFIPILPLKDKLTLKPMTDIETRYYFRLSTADQTGVLAQISKALGDHDISIASVIQKETNLSTQSAEIVIMTYPAKEKSVQNAIDELKRLSVVRDINNFVRVEDY
jgi:homoserine dehydrogenase